MRLSTGSGPNLPLTTVTTTTHPSTILQRAVFGATDVLDMQDDLRGG